MSSKKLLNKVLNINTVLRDEYEDYKNSHENISNLTRNIQNNVNSNYKIKKYLGKGIGGDIYLVKDGYICKVVNINKTDKGRVLIELCMLNVLSNNENSKKYINPCIDFGFNKDELYMFFPVFSGYKLNNLTQHLKKLNYKDFIYTVKYLIRNILNAITSIHKKNIAHQNLDSSSIVVSSDNKNMQIKLVDFGLACGVYNVPENDMVDLVKQMGKKQKYNALEDTYYQSCLNAPEYFLSTDNKSNLDNKQMKDELQKIINKTFKNHNQSEYIKLAQLYDVWCCGKIFYDLIHSRDVNSSLQNASDIDGLDNKMSWYTKFNIFGKRSSNNDLKNYSQIIEKHMLSPIKERKSARYVLNKLLTEEKYQNY